MNIQQIRYAVALAETLNFTEAAKMLSISQPSLTGGIRKLEEELGYSLFERNTKKVSLTEQGNVFIANARPVIDSMEQLEKTVKHEQEADYETLTIGLNPNYHYLKIPEYICEYARLNPKVYFSVLKTDQVGFNQWDMLKNGKMSFAFFKKHDTWNLDEYNVVWHDIKKENLYICGKKEVVGDKPVTVEALDKMKVTGFVRDNSFVMRVLRDVGIDPLKNMVPSNIMGYSNVYMREYNKTSDYICLCSEGLAREEFPYENQTIQPLVPAYSYDTGLIHYNRPLSAREKDFMEFILSKFNK